MSELSKYLSDNIQNIFVGHNSKEMSDCIQNICPTILKIFVRKYSKHVLENIQRMDI